ncbi:MAG: hypothetical protein IPK83_10915 [Planctomycetes bacterium]|nr:hypothetical protein [Planctomycetota bacterium]
MHFNPTTGQHTSYRAASGALPTDNILNIEVAPDGSVWVASMSFIWPYPGGLSHFDGQSWTTYRAGTSPLPHNQNGCLASRPLAGGGYELWVGTISEGVAVITNRVGIAARRHRRRRDADATDQSLFVSVLIGIDVEPEHVSRSDLNGDGIANGADVQPMVVALIGG